MAVSLPCYSTREDVKRALDIAETARNNAQVDRAIEAARDDIDGMCKRRFYSAVETHYWDWPNFQRAYPWRIWFDQAELADVTSTVPVVTTGGTNIPSSAIFWGNPRYAPPFTYMELDRSQNYSFGVGDTPQRDVSITGMYGYWTRTTPAGQLAAAMTDTTSATATLSNGATAGVGDVLTVGTERMLVQDKQMTDTGVSFSGASTDKASDNVIAVADGTLFTVGEVLAIDAEWMLLIAVTGDNLQVKRAWDGTVLAAHTGGTLYANRALTVTRGDLGSTAATHLIDAAASIAVVPGLVRELSVAEAINHILQETSGYARTLSVAGAGNIVPGGGLPDLRAKVLERYGRKSRQRVI